MPVSSKQDSSSHENTRSISFRLPKDLVDEIQTEAELNAVTPNVLVHRILKKHTKWDTNAEKAGYIPVTKGLISALLDKIPDNEIIEIAKRVEKKEFEDIALLFRHRYDIETALDLIEMRARASGFPYRFNVKGNIFSIIIQHDINEKWSLYLMSRYKQIFEDLGITRIKFHTTAKVIQFDLYMDSSLSK